MKRLKSWFTSNLANAIGPGRSFFYGFLLPAKVFT